jgi:NADPH-dependent curcumin reductase
MSSRMNHQWRLAARPVGNPSTSDFSWAEESLPVPGEGQVLVRNLYLSLDPTMRGWMSDAPGYMPPVNLGAVMRGTTVGRVVASNAPSIAPGSLVTGLLGWQEYAAADARAVSVLPELPGIPMNAYLALFGHIGMTAYFGLLDIGKPKAGETLVVSAAAGAVGSLVGQIGKIVGCRVVGIAGSDAKCRWLTEELGFDEAINYKTGPIYPQLRKACPDGIDIQFENVGGEILEAALSLINLRARIAVCGLIAQYNATERVPGPSNLGMLIVRRARMEGFLVSDYMARAGEAFEALGKWYAEGRLQYRADEVEGLQNAPAALNRLFTGENTGKLMVKVGEDR